MDTKISRKGFFSVLFTGIVGLVLSQIPTGKKLFAASDSNTYGNSVYGGVR